MRGLVVPRGLHNVGGSDDSAVGFELLSQFKIRIDYPRRRLWLQRRRFGPLVDVTAPPASEPPAGGFELAGARARQLGSRILMTAVPQDSIAGRRGILVGDAFFINETLDTDEQLGALALEIASGSPLEVSRVVDEVEIDVELPATAPHAAE